MTDTRVPDQARGGELLVPGEVRGAAKKTAALVFTEHSEVELRGLPQRMPRGLRWGIVCTPPGLGGP